MDRKKTKAGAILLLLGIAMTGNAQSYVTYNHDSSKKNLITVMEIGSGSLSPELYYQLLHSNYKKSAANKNKLSFRTSTVSVLLTATATSSSFTKSLSLA